MSNKAKAIADKIDPPAAAGTEKPKLNQFYALFVQSDPTAPWFASVPALKVNVALADHKGEPLEGYQELSALTTSVLMSLGAIASGNTGTIADLPADTDTTKYMSRKVTIAPIILDGLKAATTAK